MNNQTIFALSSAPGKAGVAIIRISGAGALDTLTRVTGLKSPAARYAHRIKVKQVKTKEILDDGLALYFPAPNSFTGEDVVELHLHGSRAVLDETTTLLCEDNKIRLADAGEFTRRAFDNGKFDLTAAEGLADLVNAETALQRRQAQRQMRGELATLYNNWRESLVNAIALFEAEIDFSDEDLPEGLRKKVDEIVLKLQLEIKTHLSDSSRGRIIREGFYVSIIGPPNAGKSSLLNRLAKRDVAIVSETAGTTRDIIEVHLDLSGYAVTLADTAGLREARNDIESEGVARALNKAKNSDLRIVVFDGEKWPSLDETTFQVLQQGNALAVINKADLGLEGATHLGKGGKFLRISAKTGEGLDALLGALCKEVSNRYPSSEGPTITRHRHRVALIDCAEALQRFSSSPAVELAAEDLRLAIHSLGKITGRVHVEDVLELIFKEFCIGK